MPDSFIGASSPGATKGQEKRDSSTAVAVPILPALPSAPAMQTADGFIVVSKLMLKPWVAPGRYQYSYHHYDNLPDADEHYRDLEAGEYGQWQAHAIIPTLRGIPLGSIGSFEVSGFGTYYVKCENCDCAAQGHESEADAIAAWERRPPMTGTETTALHEMLILHHGTDAERRDQRERYGLSYAELVNAIEYEARAAITDRNTRAGSTAMKALEEVHPVFAFLLGSGPLNGHWFGDEPPRSKGKRPQPYWWRVHLRDAIRSLTLPRSEGER